MRNKAFEKLISKGLSKAKYRHLEACKRDLFEALHAFKGLAPDYDTFVFDDGEEKTLVNVNGTIPINYKGNTYNIPVCFWLLSDYPSAAPMAYVKPTRDMQIKASTSVDLNGKIFIPYLEEWRQPDSNLLDLIQICTLVFGQSPPVFSKGKSASTTASPAVIPTNGISRQSSLQQDVATPTSANGDSPRRQTSSQNGGESSKKKRDEDFITEEQLKASFVTAVESKLKVKLEEELLKTKAEIDSLHSTNKELLDGQEKIDDILKELSEAEKDLDGHVEALNIQDMELEAALLRLKELEEKKDVDEFVVVKNACDAQIVDAVAADSVLDDGIYSLGRVFDEGIIECDVYLKKVRDLSRKQFLQRATILKCESKNKMRESRLKE